MAVLRCARDKSEASVRVRPLVPGLGRCHMDAHRGQNLGPECNGKPNKDYDKGAEQGLETRAAGRKFVAMTVDIGHQIISQNERRPCRPLSIAETAVDLRFSLPSHSR